MCDGLSNLQQENERLQQRIRDLERTLQERSGSLLDRILDAIPGGIVHVAPTGAILLANQQAQQFLGLSFNELTDIYTVDFAGKTYRDDGSLCPVEEYPVSRCLMTGKQQAPTTIGVQQPDGCIRWAVFTAIPIPHEEQITAMVIFVDITERMEAEAEHKTLQNRLQRTERLASMGTLAAGMAHEINNPLTFIIGNLSLIMMNMPPDDPKQAALLGEVREGAMRISRIVHDLLQFTRTNPALSVAVDIRRELDRAVSIASAEFRHRAQLVQSCPPLPPVQGSEGRLMQVFVNLLINAAQSIEVGHSEENTITVSGRSEGSEVIIEIEDTGSGMDEATRHRALDPFFTTKPIGSGIGLGLSISQNIIRNIGGTLSIDSTVGQGTRITLRLPVSESPAAAPSQPRILLQRNGNPLQVLIIDDEPSILKMLSQMLKDCILETTSRGQDAVKLCEETPFDVILCDMMMPDCTGMDVYARLQQAHPGLEARVLFMSGGAYTEPTKQFLAEIDNDCISKPFSLMSLWESLLKTANQGR
ncbi:MAG: PAS domain S-box-containing protein [Myxococcota bacterium]|jgi:PAS domain S-box-containing protein